MSKNEIIAYKGFNKDLQCRDYQYKIGKTFKHKGEVETCKSGFHACEYPFDVFNYYPPPDSRFARVKASGKISKEEDGDTKIACGTLEIEEEIKIPTLIKKAVEWIMDKVDWGDKKETNTGYRSAATNSGDQSAATNTGYRSVATNTGDWSAATNSGDWSVATNSGNQSAATNTGYRSAATNTGYRSAATNSSNQSAATNTGNRSVAEVSGEHSIAAAFGENSKAKASEFGAIVCVYRKDDGELIHIRASKIGDDGIKPDTWYTLDEDGNFVEVD